LATSRYFTCASCRKEQWAGSLFKTLQHMVRSRPSACDCGQPRHLKLTFQFGLEAGEYGCKVLSVFLPESRYLAVWEDSAGGTVTFYPFLVIVASIEDDHQSVWLPYWHVVRFADRRRPQTKYGQWAPHMTAPQWLTFSCKPEPRVFLSRALGKH
jgi:hypothetical protein